MRMLSFLCGLIHMMYLLLWYLASQRQAAVAVRLVAFNVFSARMIARWSNWGAVPSTHHPDMSKAAASPQGCDSASPGASLFGYRQIQY
jgi:hypothetical protein